MFAWWNILLRTNSAVPPDSFGLRAVLCEEDFKPSFSIVAWLMPASLPETISDGAGREPTAMLGIRSVSILVERRFIALVILNLDDLPFSTEIDAWRALRVLHGREQGVG